MTSRADTPHHVFEVSWEVCNKVGGIYTVVSSKAETLVQRYGVHYVVVGPWLLSETDDSPFDPEPGYEEFSESCREMGIPVRVGRWRIQGRPLTVQVEFSGLYGKKDDLLKELWEQHEVDSLTGGWDYVEPVVFGHAAGRVIEKWWQDFVAPRHLPAVAQFHEWMTGSGMLYLRTHAPEIASVFTTHATMLGRSIASTGVPPLQGLGDRSSAKVAEERGVVAKHSIEGICARKADVFTTVSAITAAEVELYHKRTADPVLPNGIDLGVVDGLVAPHPRESARAALVRLAEAFTGRAAADACLLAISGRYEFHNKGIDVLLDALAALDEEPGRGIVLFVLVPAGHAGIRPEVQARLDGTAPADGPLGVCTHNLPEHDKDPVVRRCRELGLDNAADRRVRVVQVPIYIGPGDGLFQMPYEAVLRGFDLTCFPSFYEPWGYTPQESVAVGVPTVTTDFAGFGAWMREQGIDEKGGVRVLPREGRSDAEVRDDLAHYIGSFAAQRGGASVEACRTTALRTSWSDLVANYERAFALAVERAHTRFQEAKVERFRPRIPVPVLPKADAQRPRLFDFGVSATLPVSLSGLSKLANNYWWSWIPEARALFEDLSPRSWEACGHSPLHFLRSVFEDDVARRAADKGYAARLADVLARFDAYMAEKARELPLERGQVIDAAHPIAYLCAEFGVHESLPIYSGGLGILAGDHLKSASDLNLPLVGVGLFYKKGYMRQQLDLRGEQIAVDHENDPRHLALELVLDENREPAEITISLPSSSLVLRAWRARIGRVDLYLLDADCPQNRPEDRAITERLYAADPETRLRQLITLGRGGVRMLARLGIDPAVYHVNEGHGAFAALERVAQLVRRDGLTFDQARQFVRATTAFTTHTPVPAGHDRFSEDLMRRYFSDVPGWAGIDWGAFVAFGRAEGRGDDFNMTYLALHFADSVNGVSQLHGEVSRELLQSFWSRLLVPEIPVGSVTNGVHLSTWVNPEVKALIGAKGRSVTGEDFRKRAAAIDPTELWAVRQRAKLRLVEEVERVLRKSFFRRQDSPSVLGRMLEGLTEDALLIGFARRFVPYKRATLAFREADRLAAILSNEKRPVRMFFSGKAHPADGLGQELVKRVAEIARKEEFIGKVFFLENYDVEIARFLVQGVDVWLNTPIRRLEASGTSGMKVAANGGLNLSILDGWWKEGYDYESPNGWSIGNQSTFPDQELQNELDAENLYRLLEEEVVPLFFERDARGVPRAWLERVGKSLTSIPPRFDSDRMVAEYRDKAYVPLGVNWFDLTANRFGRVHVLAERAARIRKHFNEIHIVKAVVTDLDDFHVGDVIEARVEANLAGLAPSEVTVELVLGHTRGDTNLQNPVIVSLAPDTRDANGIHSFRGSHRMVRSGNYAYGLRVRPKEAAAWDQSLRDLVLWA